MTLLEEVAELLEELGLGSYAAQGGNIFLAAMPPTPDLAVALTRQAGRESDFRARLRRTGGSGQGAG